MEKKCFVEIEFERAEKVEAVCKTNPVHVSNDSIVNTFVNKEVSMESLIEKELFNKKHVNYGREII